MGESDKEIKNKKTRSAGKRIRDIKRLLDNQKFQISQEKKTELEDEIKALKNTISKNKSSYKKKLNKYLQYKKNKQKTMRFVELVKVKRKINQLQKLLVETLKNKVKEYGNQQIEEDENNSGTESEIETNEVVNINNPRYLLDLTLSENDTFKDKVFKIKSEIAIYKRYEDYIRLLPFFKGRKYIPLFSNTELDAETLERRNQYINDIQELKEELRRKKVKTSESSNLSIKDSFLVQEGDLEYVNNLDKHSNTLNRDIKKIEYSIGGNKKSNKSDFKARKSNNFKKNMSEKQENAKSNFNNYLKSESETKTKVKPSNSHVIFSDSD
ncbi:uncharacterized protein cubi_02000 [Cryptosporidium ubiquitum]|uniref:Uncharacterized protein n=1 Tax=Cryptosporidium ubiquitum TaxID=857276 RepID=A0A1J4MN60_9CRYT|nr:uncharacterized protein cubi_02000 [Cryptosporidium ubiquitum]OII75479.1 hypothetical protein cubi_02000 [Cryptosporidium ubiquitum]